MSVTGLTSLEASLIGVLGVLLVTVTVRLFMSSNFLTKEQWQREDKRLAEERKHLEQRIDTINKVNEKQFQEISNKQDKQFRMLRSMVLCLPIEDSEKRKILNGNGGSNG
ncbi:MAG: hypothetical protein ACLFM3_08455 [Desulfohalobiaceae bacterium]